MKITHMVYVILAFGIVLSLVCYNLPLITENTIQNYETERNNQLATTERVVKTTDIEKATDIEVAVPSVAIQEEKKEEPVKPKVVPVSSQKTVTAQSAIVFDGMTIEQLSVKLDKNLKSTLSGKGNIFANYSIEYGIDPYLAVAIVLHETGCNWSCSSAVKNKNNVGGMMSGGRLIHFNSLDEGIMAFIKNLKEKYYDHGLNTPELMNKKYAANPNWHVKINSYIEKIKNA